MTSELLGKTPEELKDFLKSLYQAQLSVRCQRAHGVSVEKRQMAKNRRLIASARRLLCSGSF